VKQELCGLSHPPGTLPPAQRSSPPLLDGSEFWESSSRAATRIVHTRNARLGSCQSRVSRTKTKVASLKPLWKIHQTVHSGPGP
jgi:hypothetical protein